MKRTINRLLGLFNKEVRATHAPLQTFERGIQCLRGIDIEVVVDVGVAHGTPELYRAYQGKKFLLVEANPAFEGAVRAWADKLGAKVAMVFCGEKEGTEVLRIWSAQSGSKFAYEGRGVKQELSVPTTTLDVLMEQNGLRGSTLLKVDAEGAEMEVLRGATETLKHCKAIIMELHFLQGYIGQAPAEELIDFLYGQGFRIYNIMEGGGIDKHGRLSHADFIFVRN